MMAHTWGQILLKCPELAIEAEEAKRLSDAYMNFCEHHAVPVLTEKRLSEINLIAALCVVEGTRFVAISKRLKDEREARQQQRPTAVPINARVAH